MINGIEAIMRGSYTLILRYTAIRNVATYYYGMIELNPCIHGDSCHGLGITRYMQKQSPQWHSVSPWHPSKFIKIWGRGTDAHFAKLAVGEITYSKLPGFFFYQNHIWQVCGHWTISDINKIIIKLKEIQYNKEMYEIQQAGYWSCTPTLG